MYGINYKIRRFYHHLIDYYYDLAVIAARKNYSKICHEFETGSRRPPYKIGFFVSNTSKWKLQTVYDALVGDPLFEPIVILTFSDSERDLCPSEKRKIIDSNKGFFASRGVRCVEGYKRGSLKCKSINNLSLDFVFFQTPWGISSNQSPSKVAKFALPCYVPYFVPTYVRPSCELLTNFHRMLAFHFLYDEKLVSYMAEMQSAVGWGDQYAGKLVVAGHPTVDEVFASITHSSRERISDDRFTVIYAPHWSLDDKRMPNGYNLSTILWSGEPILDFARHNRQIKWIFKPHPTLRGSLRVLWPKEKVDAYYQSWEEIGVACYDGDYIKLFNESNLMITDCDSFLMEYGLTGKPIIHLIGSGVKTSLFSLFSDLINTYYKVHGVSELSLALDEFVLRKSDPRLNEREQIIGGIINSRVASAHGIVSQLRHIVGHC